MKNWPKKWIDAANPYQGGYSATGMPYTYSPEDILEHLQEEGALKDPPEPRKWKICLTHDLLMEIEEKVCRHSHHGYTCQVVHVREVMEEDDI